MNTTQPHIQKPLPGPFVHGSQYTRQIMWDVALALAPASVCACYFFGLAAFLTIVLCVVSSLVFEAATDLFLGRKIRISDGSAFVTGLLFAFNLPAQAAPWYVCVMGSFIAIVVVKAFFGGLGKNIFNPALVARLVCMAIFPVALSSFGAPVHSFALLDGIAAATPLSILKTDGAHTLVTGFGTIQSLYHHLLIGDHAGSLGETSIVALFIGGVYLLIRKIISWHIPVAMIATVGIVAAGAGFCGVQSGVPIIHMLSGGLFLGAFFMATDYVTAPVYPIGKIIFGIGCGLLIMVIRLWGTYPEGCMFAILAMNIVVPLIDRNTVPRRFGSSTAHTHTRATLQ